MASYGMLPSISNGTCWTNSVAEIRINMTTPYCGVAIQIGSNNTTEAATAAMKACCKSAPIIYIEDGCDIYCNIVDQSADQLSNCLIQSFGASKGNTAGVSCRGFPTNSALANTSNKSMLATILGLVFMLGFTW
jgi:hypothetical protein